MLTNWQSTLTKDIRRMFVLVWLLIGVTAPAFAQATGAFNGRVVDAGGGVLPGVTVAATHVRTRGVRTTVTNNEGLYSLSGLDPGLYEVKVELAGFGSEAARDVTLTVGSTITFNFTLQPAAVQETVTVTGTAAMIELTQSEVKSELQTKQLESLPMANRNFAGLVALMPSARVGIPHDTTKTTVGGVSFAGSNGENVNPTVDGGDNRDDYNGGILMSYTLESIEQFKLSAHNFSASEGRTAGAALAIVTKSGTNSMGGSAFVFNRNGALAAKDYFTKVSDLPKPPLSRQQFGGSLGGPIIHDRIFYFGALERTLEDRSLTLSNQLMSELKLLGPFGAKPQQQIDQPYHDLQYLAKLNFRFSDNQSGFLRWAQQRNSDLNHASFTPTRDQAFPQFGRNQFFSFLGSLTSVISPTLLNQLTVQGNYWQITLNTQPEGAHNPATGNLTFPSVSIGRTQCEVDGQTKVQARDDFSAALGTHNLKFGGDFSFYPTLMAGVCHMEDGVFTFFDDPSTILGDKVRYPQGFQTPGGLQSYAQATPGYSNASVVGAKQIAAYAQDDWRVTRRLTLNLGARYDLEPNFLNNSQLDQNRTYLALKAIGSPFGQLPKTPLNNLSPRTGFAYQLGKSDKTVLRGGYGLYFDSPTSVFFFRAIDMMKPQINITGTKTNTAIGVGDLAQYRFGIDPVPPGPGLITQLPFGANTQGEWIDPAYKNPSVHKFNLGFSRQFSSSLVLNLDYVHSLGYNEFRVRDINPVANGVRRLAPTFGAMLGDPNLFGRINLATTAGQSEFRSLTFKLEGRVPRVSYRATYELSKAAGYGGYTEARRGSYPVNQDNLLGPGEWGPTTNDEMHRVVLFGTIEVPHGVQVSPIFQAATARPYRLTAGRDLNGDGINNDLYVDPATGQPVAVNSQRGDSTVVMDTRVTRLFNLGAGRRLGVFAEFYNLFNTANFGNTYNGNARSTLFRQPVGLAPGDIGQPFRAQIGARFMF